MDFKVKLPPTDLVADNVGQDSGMWLSGKRYIKTQSKP